MCGCRSYIGTPRWQGTNNPSMHVAPVPAAVLAEMAPDWEPGRRSNSRHGWLASSPSGHGQSCVMPTSSAAKVPDWTTTIAVIMNSPSFSFPFSRAHLLLTPPNRRAITSSAPSTIQSPAKSAQLASSRSLNRRSQKKTKDRSSGPNPPVLVTPEPLLTNRGYPTTSPIPAASSAGART